MSLPDRAFSGATFFIDIRKELNQGRGLFAGQDGDIQYVVMDACLYKMNCFIRPDTSTFTVAALDLMAQSTTRVVINGNYFVPDYNYFGPGPSSGWYGQVIKNKQLIASAWTDETGDQGWRNRAFIGREASSAIWRYHAGSGCGGNKFCRPRDYETQNGISFDQAMGGMLPLIVEGLPIPSNWEFGLGAEGVGKTIVGVHRDAGCLFVISQHDRGAVAKYTMGSIFGDTISNIATRLWEMGVTHALKGDGSTSATLIVDGEIYSAPLFYFDMVALSFKDNTIPVGLAFELVTLQVGGPGAAGTFEVDPETDDPSFLSQYLRMTSWNGVQAVITTGTHGGLILTISSLGNRGNPWPSVLDAMATGGAPGAPLRLSSVAMDLRSDVTFFGPATTPGFITLTAGIVKPANSSDPNDYFQGTFNFAKPGPTKIVGRIRAVIRT